MKTAQHSQAEAGSTVVIALFTTLILGGFVALAVDYTGNIGRNAQRDRVFNNAVEIGDGCLEMAFGSWRQLSKTAENPATNTFAVIPTPSPGNFPNTANFTVSRDNVQNVVVSNYKVQAVDPTVTLSSDNPPISALSTSATPPNTTGNGTGTKSYFYLATADVTLPYASGKLTAKVRRVFEKRYTSAWNWAMLYDGDLELHPDSKLTLNGWVHSNGDVYVGNGKPTPTPAADATPDPSATPVATPTPNLELTDRLTYAGTYHLGYSPNETAHADHTNVAAPVTPADLPPGRENNYAPFGWDNSKFDTADSNPDNDGYREMIEKPNTPWSSSATADPFKDQRLYNTASVVVEVDASNNITVSQGTSAEGRTAMTSRPNGNNERAVAWDVVMASITTNSSLQDARWGSVNGNASVRVVNLDMAKFVSAYKNAGYKGWNGIIYIADTSGTATTKRGVRIVNGAQVPPDGISVVSPNPVYVQGDFNTGNTGTNVPSNNGNFDDPDASGYTRKPASIMADAITILSGNWKDDKSSYDITAPEKIAVNTTVNAALISGNVASKDGYYSGGGENFVRFLENWDGKNFTYYGSMLGLYESGQATGRWGMSDYYRPPTQKWYFDSTLSVDSGGNPVSVPGYVSTVSYLQQQRWYLQY